MTHSELATLIVATANEKWGFNLDPRFSEEEEALSKLSKIIEDVLNKNLPERTTCDLQPA